MRVICRERAEENALENARRAQEQYTSPSPPVNTDSPQYDHVNSSQSNEARERMREIARRKRHEMKNTKIDMNAQSELMATFEGSL